MEIKYDIHTLLVDTQNYFKQEQEKQNIRKNLFQVESANDGNEESDDQSSNRNKPQSLLPMPLKKQFSG